MHSTKTEILALLKRSDGATVDELCTSLGLASMTVRQHLTALERDQLVAALEVRRATGRPHFRYRLTDGGHRHVARGFDRMVALLADAACALDPEELRERSEEERRALLFARAASALAARHAGRMNGAGPAERAVQAVEILGEHGGFAEWHEGEAEIDLRDFSCVYRSTGGAIEPCPWHETMLSELFLAPARMAPADGSCAACCRYLITVSAGGAERKATT